MMTLPPDFPPDLRRALGIPQDRLPPYPGHVPLFLAPVTPQMREALAESRKTKGESH